MLFHAKDDTIINNKRGLNMLYKYNKESNLVTIANSILKHFTGIKLNKTCKELDTILEKKEYKKIVVMLFDGLGASIREKHLSENDFLRKREKITISSVFPPTTVAATTSFLSGLYPSQNGWLGWQQYFKQHDLIIEMFTNVNPLTREKINPPYLSSLYCSYTSILDLINSNSNTKAYSLFPDKIDPKGAKDLNDFFTLADKMMKRDESHFIYMYWPEPDSLIHEFGTNHYYIRSNVKKINKMVQKLAKSNKDNLILVLADHSLVDTKFFYTFEHDDFSSCLKTITSLDSRSSFFHVKPDKINEFPLLFDKYYGKFFVLKSKEEVINEEWFGPKEYHPLFNDFIGEFMATSISEYGFTNYQEETFIGAHAGSTKEESLINISIINQ